MLRSEMMPSQSLGFTLKLLDGFAQVQIFALLVKINMQD